MVVASIPGVVAQVDEFVWGLILETELALVLILVHYGSLRAASGHGEPECGFVLLVPTLGI